MSQANDYLAYSSTVGRSFADWYSGRRDSWTGADTNDLVTEFVLQSAPPARGVRLRVLDIGCGRGWQTTQIAQRLDADVVGLDLLDVWDAPQTSRGSARLHQGDFLGFHDESLDMLVDNGCLHHQRREEWHSWVAHGRQLLRPGGVWVVSCFLSPTGEVTARPLPDGRLNWWLTEASLASLFGAVGLAVTGRREIERNFQTRDGYRLKYLALAFGEE